MKLKLLSAWAGLLAVTTLAGFGPALVFLTISFLGLRKARIF